MAGIVLAGGAARRMSGVDKPMLEVGGMPLLRRAISALRGVSPVIVVGPRRAGLPPVTWTREEPPGGGPVAGLAAGLALVPPGKDLVVVLAADLPGLRPSTVDKLVAALGAADGAVLVDADGKRQWLIGAWRTARLRAALPSSPGGVSMRKLLGGLSTVTVGEAPGESADVDTPADLERHAGRL
ncbi:molybdenum cofactor guanylyltransferase [Amycolatopsis taiwanensis]|uniref:molybdenum cofactor guanylyltransferase n=1 Tax=Amycolatopsis taiwanensis TaxID=342230 RepID=UPI0005C20C97|nr:molybdenum cofactor guanylyltransferase [Amycolatopsis taiwanensis]